MIELITHEDHRIGMLPQSFDAHDEVLAVPEFVRNGVDVTDDDGPVANV